VFLVCLVGVECARSFLAVQATGVTFVSFVRWRKILRLEGRGGGGLGRLSNLIKSGSCPKDLLNAKNTQKDAPGKSLYLLECSTRTRG
jgi:hypothetical protein